MMNNKIVKIGTFFSGIGSPEKALERLKNEKYILDYKVQFFSEIDKNAIKSYCAVHDIDESLNLGDIREIKGNVLPYCDLWIGGFPCQDISCAGKMRGFDFKSSTRSSHGWEMIRLLSEIKEKPKFVIFENVAMITSKEFEDTLKLFKEDLENLGYTLYEKLLCATDYGMPQTRTRYFLIAVLDKEKIFEFPEKQLLDTCINDYLENKVDEKYYLSSSKYIDNNNKRIFYHKNRKDIEYEIDINKYLIGGVCGVDKHSKYHQSSRIFSNLGNAPTITASNTSDNIKIVVEDEFEMRIRKITPKECWRLMGFTDTDFEKASEVCSETHLYCQAGNSIVVNVIYNILKALL